MNAKENGQAQAVKEHYLEVFNFAETKTEIRSTLINGNPYFIGSDVAKALGYQNPNKAVRDHCKGGTNCSTLTNGGTQIVKVIPEGDVYRLIIKSTLPSAEKFERWVMEEVLPAIRKKGFYKAGSKADDFIDARDVPHNKELINNYAVTVIYLNEKMYLINDLNRAIQSTTSAGQIVKKLNAKRQLATKIWLYGQTNPTWFTTELGKQLIFSGSRIENRNQQLLLPLPTQKGGANGN